MRRNPTAAIAASKPAPPTVDDLQAEIDDLQATQDQIFEISDALDKTSTKAQLAQAMADIWALSNPDPDEADDDEDDDDSEEDDDDSDNDDSDDES